MRHRLASGFGVRRRIALGAALLLSVGGVALGWAVSSYAATKHTAAADDAKTAAAAYRPNVELQTQNGKTVRFYDDLVAGRVVLINFMFTSCNNICPPMTANLVQVQRLLKEEMGDRVVIISITVDPETDTPAVLKAYAERFATGPGWFFLTGARDRIEAVVSKLGDNSRDKLKHSGMLLIGNDPARTWNKVFAMSPPEEIAAVVRKMLVQAAVPTPATPVQTGDTATTSKARVPQPAGRRTE